MQVAHWCVTIQVIRLALDELQRRCDKAIKDGIVKYVVFQLERGEATGRDHFQLYVEFARSTRIAAVKTLFGAHIHADRRKGTREQARQYCMKTDTRLEGPWEYGVWNEVSQGRRSDLEEIKEKLDNGTPFEELYADNFGTMVRNYRGIERYIRAKIDVQQRKWKTRVYALWGDTNTGKTHRCHEAAPDAYWLMKPPKKDMPIYWDGYRGQADVIVDECYGWLTLDYFLRLCDRWPHMLNCRGSQVSNLIRRIFFTSNTDPENWYKSYGTQEEAYKRRFTKIIWVQDREQIVDFSCECGDGCSSSCICSCHV